MVNICSDIKPHYSNEDNNPKMKKINNFNSGTITEMVKIINKNKKILEELEKKDENLYE